MTALLELHEATAGYGDVRIIHGISLTVKNGSITALVGGNGAGKTTLMLMLAGILDSYSNLEELLWVQEEPKNMGSWSFIAPRIAPILRGNQRLCYAGRNESASPAAGYSKVHEQERLAMLRAAYSVV